MINSPNSIVEDIRSISGTSANIVFVYGVFNVLHPGHFRLLNFAKDCGDFLIVGVLNDGFPGVTVKQSSRLQAVRQIGIINYSFIVDDSVLDLISLLKPNFVVKGKEFIYAHNPEKVVVESYGGKLIFSSGEARLTSFDLASGNSVNFEKSGQITQFEYIERHKCFPNNLINIVDTFKKLKVLVIGDLIVDEYITCDPIGMSMEDPTIVVTPINQQLFVGGAGIVAAHAAGLGAKVKYLGVLGNDVAAAYANETLEKYGVNAQMLCDESRPTTLKQRYRAHGKTLLKVSYLKQHQVSLELCEQLIMGVESEIKNIDLLIFSDFNYGCLPQFLVDEIIKICKRENVPMVADSQSSSQTGDISRFRGMLLITPTEHEARLALADSTSGLVSISASLQEKSHSKNIFITLGSEGVFIHSPESNLDGVLTDRLLALNTNPKDVAGGGDCLFVASALSLVAGANIWTAAYIGSLAAACQVGRLGNLPQTVDELKRVILK